MENVKYIPGDLVIYQGQICEVKGSILHYTKLLYNVKDNMVDAESLQGLPLTPRILETNGWKMGSFERDEDDFLFQPCYKRGSILNFDYYSELSIKPVVKETRSFLSAISDIKEIRLRKIEFVHQLQHLLFGLGLNSELKV